jgi:hypothetical protein
MGHRERGGGQGDVERVAHGPPDQAAAHRSSTPATYSQPSSVGMQVMSVPQIWSEPVGELVGRDRLVVATVRGDDAEAAARAALGAPRPGINIPARLTIWGDPANENDHPITLYARPWRYPRIPLLGGSGSMPSYPTLAVARPRRAIARSPRGTFHRPGRRTPAPTAYERRLVAVRFVHAVLATARSPHDGAADEALPAASSSTPVLGDARRLYLNSSDPLPPS